MLTAEDIKNAAQNVEEISVFSEHFFRLSPPVKLVHTKSGRAVGATCVDIDGKYPNTVHTEEMCYWYPAGEFEIAG